MASSKDGLRALIEQRDQLKAELVSIQGKIDGLEMAIAIFRPELASPSKDEKFSLKAFILDLLTERRGDGLNANLAVELSAKRGVSVDRASVASLLSRLKHEGAVTHDGNIYRLRQFSGSLPTELESLERVVEERRLRDAEKTISGGRLLHATFRHGRLDK